MEMVVVRSWIDLPEIRRGQEKLLPLTSRILGLADQGKLEIIDSDRQDLPGTPLHLRHDPAAQRPAAPQGTVRAVLEWVGSDPERAAAALLSELGSDRPRKTLISALEDLGSQDPVYQAMTGPRDDEASFDGSELLGDLSAS